MANSSARSAIRSRWYWKMDATGWTILPARNDNDRQELGRQRAAIQDDQGDLVKPSLKTGLALLLASLLPAAAISAAPVIPGTALAAWSLDEGRGRDTLEAVSKR